MKFKKEELLELCNIDGGRFKVYNVAEAYDFCRQVTVSHYENFPVASILIPKEERKYIYSIYAFARIADDIADELQTENIDERLNALEMLNNGLLEIEKQINSKKKNKEVNKKLTKELSSIGLNPILFALKNTIVEKSIPIKPFQKLLVAFKSDVQFKQAEFFEDITSYCNNSANPVGELILRIFNIDNPITIALSDKICTALQLANFWQDLSIDIKDGRCYIPQKFLKKYNLSKDNLQDKKNSRNLIICMNELIELTEKYFQEGKFLIKYLKPIKLRWEISATIYGGMLILKKTKQLKNDIIFKRPKLNIFDVMSITFKTLLKKN